MIIYLLLLQTHIPVKRLRQLTKILKHFHKSFASIYLNELRQSHLNGKVNVAVKYNLIVGDIVLIKDDQPLPRSKWPIAKVEEPIRGKDGSIRGAKLHSTTRTGKKGSIHRPLAKIIPFEIAEDHQTPPELPITPVVAVSSISE